ncbi:DUF6438 domain-containing protein [Natronoglomus mannanivorans]|uniref:DUF6438 domain-containing protein n=1 Tax=Natronoglomus mannanivorans TaxID=2979990 RepID=A0AAP3E4E2_9EURY|nr:hypothetical protein [Halobacteria archaeon AArc-xg1-1]
MVISIQQFNDDKSASEELGRIHNGEVFLANVEGFEDEVERMRERARMRREQDSKRNAVHKDPLSYRVRNVFHRPQLSLKDELSVVQRYKPPYGLYASVRAPKADRERLLEADLTDDVSPPQRPVDPSDVEFRLYHGPFDKEAPIYLINIAPDGYGFYEGRENTPLSSTYVFHVPEATRRELVDLCYESGFFELDHTYITADESEPLPSISTGVRIGETEKWVYNYSRTAPEALQEIEDAIRDACGVEQWLDPDGESLLEAIADEPQAAGPALAAFNAASDENLVTADSDEILETVRPALSAADRTTRRNAAEIAARNCPATDLVTNEPSRQIASDEAIPAERLNRDITTGEAFSLFEPLLTDEDEDVRDAANRAFRVLNIGTKPEAVSILFETDDERDRTTVAVQLRELVTDQPRSFRESAGVIAAELQDGEPDARAAVADMVQTIVRANPNIVEDVREELVSGLDDPDGDVRNACAKALADASITDPLIQRLEADQASVRTTALYGLARVVRDEPEIVKEISPTIDYVLTDGTVAEREQAVALLVKLAIGTDRPESLCEHARGLLVDTETAVQTNGFRLSKALISVDPNLFEPL